MYIHYIILMYILHAIHIKLKINQTHVLKLSAKNNIVKNKKYLSQLKRLVSLFGAINS